MTPEEKRKAREAAALAVIKAIRRDPNPRAAKPYLSPLEEPYQPPKPTELPGTNPEPTGYIYFVYCAGRIKIGYAADVADRMAGIRTSSPFPVTLLLTIRGSLEDEKRYHDIFHEDRMNREWFDLPLFGDLHQFLDDHLDDDGQGIWLDAQIECRETILSVAASVVNHTGGDPEGQALQRAAWPGTFEVSDQEFMWIYEGEEDD